MDAKHSAKDVLSLARTASLLGCILAAIASGTIYLYSAYSPQLGARLHASNTQLNVIGFAAHVGNYMTGPILGRVVDSMGPRLPLLGAALCYLIGYGGITKIYNDGIGAETSLPRAHFAILVICGLLTGLATSATISTAYNTAAKNFPTSVRGTAVSFAAAGMGLSAFFFSTISRVFFAGDTSALLLLLTLATSVIAISCSAIVRHIPLPHPTTGADGDETSTNPCSDAPITTALDAGDCHTPLLRGRPENSDRYVPEPASATERGRTRSSSHSRTHRLSDIHGKQLLTCPEFYALALIMAILCGTGIMYINNVGMIARALYAHSNPDYDEIEAFKWQSAQVSTLSVGNFSSRIVIGFVADYIRTHLRLPRSYCLCIVSTLFIISQSVAIGVSTVNTLWIATTMVGAAYGSLFGIFPTIVAEWFGLAHMSENMGYTLLPLAVAGNLLSFMFGQVLDAHTPRQASSTLGRQALTASHPLLLGDTPMEPRCLLGRECYVASLWVTLLLSIVALALSTWTGIRDGRREHGRKAGVADMLERDL